MGKIYSTYDEMKCQYSKLRNIRLLLIFSLAVLVTSIIFFSSYEIVNGYENLFYLIVFVLIVFFIHIVLNFFSESYSDRWKKEIESKELINQLSAKMRNMIFSTNKRKKGQQFKKAYEFTDKKIEEFEHILCIAMYHEQNEVWVTAFCKDKIVRKITATIGSAYSCRPSDSINSWLSHVGRIGCDEVRQYHNHPVTNNKTNPSSADLKSNISIRRHLQNYGELWKSYIIFWNEILEYRILEYFDNGEVKLVRYYDVSKNLKVGG